MEILKDEDFRGKMKKRAKSIIALTLAATMLAGCGGAAGDKTTKDEPKKSSMEGSGEFNRFGWEIPKETLKFTALEAYGNYAPQEAERIGEENNLKYLKDEFNIDLKVEHIGGDGKEALNLALASGDYPEVIYNVPYTMVEKFVKMGKAVDMTPYMDTVGKDLKKSMGDHYNLFLDEEEKLWYVPSLMGAITELPDNTAHLRYDEWKAIGSPEIETPDDFYNAVNAILEKFPTTPNGDKRYALSFDTDGYMRPDIMGGYWGLQRGWKIDEEGNFTHWAFTEEGKKMLKFLNRFHLDGTLDPDAFTNNLEEWMQKCSSEKLAGALAPWWVTRTAGVEVWREEDENISEDKRYFQFCFKDPDAEKATVNGKDFLGSSCTIITDKAKDPEAIMKYLNFQATDLGQALNGWGLPNGTPIGDTGREVKFWNIDEEGNWEVEPAARQAMADEVWNYTEAFYEEGMPWLFANQNRWDDGEHCIWPNQMWYDNKWMKLMIDNCGDTIYDASAMVLRNKTDEVKVAEQAVKDAWSMNWGAVVQSNSDAEFDAALKTMQDALTAANVKVLEKALSDNYKANMEKMNK